MRVPFSLGLRHGYDFTTGQILMVRQADQKAIDPKMLELLVCPLTKGRLDYDRENSELISTKARLAYPVRDGIPILLPSEARIIE